MIRARHFIYIFAVLSVLSAIRQLCSSSVILRDDGNILRTFVKILHPLFTQITAHSTFHASVHTLFYAKAYLIFRLKKSCHKKCRERIIDSLTNHYRCSEVTVLKELNYICGRCDGYPNLTPHEIGTVASTNLVGIKDFFDNAALPSISDGESAEEDSATESVTHEPPTTREEISGDSKFVQYIRGDLPWGLDRIDQKNKMLDGVFNLSCFPNLGFRSKIFVLDSGCRATHEEFRNRIQAVPVGRYRTAEDSHGHGTHVAGIAAGMSHGVCKLCSIVCVKTLDEENLGTELDVLYSVEYVIKQRIEDTSTPFVVVMSLGGPSKTTLMDDAVTQMVEMGVFVATAAGNNYDDSCNYAPARVEGVVNVGAIKKNDKLRSSSNGGSCVNAVAPGEKVRAASHLGDALYVSYSGTSMAAPHVAGVAALILSQNPKSKKLAPRDIYKMITHESKKVPDGSFKMSYPLLRLRSNDCELYEAQPLLMNKGTVGISAAPSPSAVPSPSTLHLRPTEEAVPLMSRQASKPLFSPPVDEGPTEIPKPTSEYNVSTSADQESSPTPSSTPTPSSADTLIVSIRDTSDKAVDARSFNFKNGIIVKGIGKSSPTTAGPLRVTRTTAKK